MPFVMLKELSWTAHNSQVTLGPLRTPLHFNLPTNMKRVHTWVRDVLTYILLKESLFCEISILFEQTQEKLKPIVIRNGLMLIVGNNFYNFRFILLDIFSGAVVGTLFCLNKVPDSIPGRANLENKLFWISSNLISLGWARRCRVDRTHPRIV